MLFLGWLRLSCFNYSVLLFSRGKACEHHTEVEGLQRLHYRRVLKGPPTPIGRGRRPSLRSFGHAWGVQVWKRTSFFLASASKSCSCQCWVSISMVAMVSVMSQRLPWSADVMRHRYFQCFLSCSVAHCCAHSTTAMCGEQTEKH